VHPLKALRKKRRRSQQDVANVIGCSNRLVCRAERGEPIRRKWIAKLVEWGKGELKATDFVEGDIRRGKTSKRQDQGAQAAQAQDGGA
jgi:transcriptional regulator with XRE-family HTH domain